VLQPEESLEFQSVSIDIMPGVANGCIKTGNKKGVIPVAILGSAVFDATRVNPFTCSLEGLNVSTQGKQNKPQARIVDINYDGYNDLVLQFANKVGTFTVGQTSATLTGELYPVGVGTTETISGSDTICVIP
jgi:hypothetical protein